jgi:hypothetical protein
MFLNGTRIANNNTQTTQSLKTTDIAFLIGAGAAGTNPYFNGYISGVRVTNGTALYTSTTYPIPTTPPSPTGSAVCVNMTNAAIIDNTTKNDLLTVGGVSVSTVQSKWGGSSMFFNGTTGYLESKPYPGNLSGVFNNGAWTIEFWAYTASTARQCFIDTRLGTASATGLTFYSNPTTPTLGLQINSIVCTSTVTVPQNAWNHIAVVSTGATATIYLNGVNVASGATSQTTIDQYLRIGATAGTAASFVSGYIDDLRITKGVARYIGNFTPPTSQLQDQ